jgi:HK97 family phage major capsid protein
MDKKKPLDSKLYRDFDIELDGERKAAVDVEARTVRVAFSSEAPVTRVDWETWKPYHEVLDHSGKSARMKRIRSGAPVLLNHNSDQQIGVVENATIDDDRVGRATLRFSNSALGEEIFRDIQDGIRRKISFGYLVHKLKTESEEEGKMSVKRATDWEPFEISSVPMPADDSVGVGRAMDDDTMKPASVVEATDDKPQRKESKMDGQVTSVAAPTEEEKRATLDNVRSLETARIREIEALGKKFLCADKATAAISNGTSVAEFRKQVLDGIPEDKAVPFKAVSEDARAGMGKADVEKYSILRAIRAQIPGSEESKGCFEREVSDTLGKKFERTAQGLFIPAEFFSRMAARAMAMKRDLTVGTNADGGFTVATDMLGLIELLRNRMMVQRLGATILDGLVGSIAIPRASAAGTAYWVAENGSVTESQQTFQQVTMSPKTVGAYTEIARKLILQSSIGIEQFVTDDLSRIIALAIDLAALHGTGASNQPTGIAATAGIGSVVGGTNGAAPTWDHIVDLETQVAIDNADIGALAYLSNAKVRGKLKRTVKFSSTGIPVWDDGNEPGVGMMNGYGAFASNQVSSTLDKGTSTGVCSAIFFGNWRDLLIGGWGALDLLVDPYTNSATGAVRIRALQSVDIAVRHPESFAAMLDALTV